MTYTDAVINNKSAQVRAKSFTKKEVLRQAIYKNTGWMPSKDLSMKAMKEAVKV